MWILEKCRDIELKIIEHFDIRVDKASSLWKSSLPRQINLTEEVNVNSNCRSICSYKGVTYVGLENGVAKIIESDYSLQPFISNTGVVTSVSLHRDMLYLLCNDWNNSPKIGLYDLNGQLISSCSLYLSCQESAGSFVIVGGRVVVPIKRNEVGSAKRDQQLRVYSLEGKLIKRINCPQMNEYSTHTICAVDSHSVVVSSNVSRLLEPSKIFRINIDTEEVNWTSRNVDHPDGLTCYGEDFVLVADYNSKPHTISVLDVKTG